MKFVKPVSLTLLAGALGFAFLGENPLHASTRSAAYFNNLLHFPLGILFYAVLHLAFRQRIKPIGLFWIAVIAQGFFELIQPLVGRSASWLDLALATLGILFLWCCCSGLPRVTSLRRRVVVGAVLVGIAVAPGVILLNDEQAQIRNLPRIADFEHWLESTRWEAQGGKKSRAKWADSEFGYGLVLEVEDPSGYPGVNGELGGQDWSGYNKLSLRVFLKGPPGVLLTLRLDDQKGFARYAERLDETHVLVEGENFVSIEIDARIKPNGEAFNLKQVQRMIIHLSGAEVGTQMLLDEIQLH